MSLRYCYNDAEDLRTLALLYCLKNYHGEYHHSLLQCRPLAARGDR